MLVSQYTLEQWSKCRQARLGAPARRDRSSRCNDCGHWNWSHGQCFETGRILALCDPGGFNPVLGGAVAFAPYPTVVKFLIDRLSSPGAPGALAFRLVSVSAGCPVQ